MPKTVKDEPIPVIDLFAGPGGLGEGFSRFPLEAEKKFRIALSIEKDPYAHQTLTLRAFYRGFPEKDAPPDYYAYLRGEISKDELFDAFPEQAKAAKEEARLLTLGEDDVRPLIEERIRGRKDWVLIGGPPCQAYSLVGRSRMLGGFSKDANESLEEFERRKTKEFENDHRHQLYKEYLKILADHAPPVFIMENVKGILSSKLGGKPIFPEILKDLQSPRQSLGIKGEPLEYRIYSLSHPPSDLFGEGLEPSEYIIKAEEYGVPQARHRVILLGIRTDVSSKAPGPLEKSPKRTVSEAITDLPSRTSGVSKGEEQSPRKVLEQIPQAPWWFDMFGDPKLESVQEEMERTLGKVRKTPSRGTQFSQSNGKTPSFDWYHDPELQGVCNHETRSHIPEDLHRYFFCSCFAKVKGRPPHLKDFPKGLLPKHKNVEEALKGQKFGDRFRVQIKNKPATTVTSHISKDGHYFIHPDPKQCRSLTVREAARLQTFPDNYFFEGPRTSQFHQVGNAVPPYLAYQIAEIVSSVIGT